MGRIRKYDEVAPHFFRVDGVLVRIFVRTKGWHAPATMTSPPDGEETRTIEAVDIKPKDGPWMSFDKTIQRSQIFHGLEIGEAMRHPNFTPDDLPAYQLYETARLLVEEGKWHGREVKELLPHEIPADVRE